MQKKELIDRLDELEMQEKTLEKGLKIVEKRAKWETLSEKMNEAGFWDDPETAQSISQTASALEKTITTYDGLRHGIKAIKELQSMMSEAEMEAEIAPLERKAKELEELSEFSGEYDEKNAILTIKVGNGGQDAEDFAAMLLRMYARWSEKNGMKAQITEKSESDVGIKSATLEIKGEKAYGRLKSEHGVHRLIRISPFNAKGLRQTSFARIEVLPEIPLSEIQLDDQDLRIDVYRSSGPGGQSVNTTDSAVRITYLPLNLTVTCQNEKSQQQNKQSALKVLMGKLIQLQIEQQAKKLNEIKGEMMENSFGSQMRTYTLQPYQLVKDHRTDTESGNPQKVLDGELEVFMKAYRVAKK